MDATTMKPEQLKVIAEGMGYESSIVNSSCFYKHPDEFESHITINDFYNPLTNNDQIVEIIEKLKIDLYYYPDEDYCWKALVRRDTQQEAITINEAVCNAAYRYFKD